MKRTSVASTTLPVMSALVLSFSLSAFAQPVWSPSRPEQFRAYRALHEVEVNCEQPEWFWQIHLDTVGGEAKWPNCEVRSTLSVGKNLGRYLFPAGPSIPVPPNTVLRKETPKQGWVKWNVQDKKLLLSCDISYPSRRIQIKKTLELATCSPPP